MHYDQRDFDDFLQLDQNDPFAQEPRTRRSILPFVLIGGAIVLGIVVVVGLALHLPKLLDFPDGDVNVTGHRDAATNRGEAFQVYSDFEASGAHWSDLSAEEQQVRDALVVLFRQLEQSTAVGDDEKVRSLVDFHRLLKRIELTGSLRGWTPFDKRNLLAELKSYVDVESFWSNIEVVGFVEPADDPNTRIVYTLCWSEESGQTENRFWVGRSDGVWKIYDWERLDLGLTTSREWGLYCKYSQSPEMDGYYHWGTLMEESDQLAAEGDYDGAHKKIRLAERTLKPRELKDYCWVLAAYRWSVLGESEEALRCCRNVIQKAKTPGVFYSLMIHYDSIDPEKALEFAELYESSVGPNPDLLETKADLLDRLNRDEEAIAEWKKLLQMRPKNVRALTEYLFALPKENKKAIEPYLSQLEDPANALIDIVDSARYQDYPALVFLVNFLQQTAPDAPGTKYATGLAKQLEGETEEAATLFRQAYETEGNLEMRDTYVDAFVEVSVEQGKVIAALKEAPNAKRTIESLFYKYDEGETELTDEEHRELVQLFTTKFPDDLDALDRQITLTMRDERYEEVERLLRPVLEKMPPKQSKNGTVGEDEFDEESYYRQSLEGSLATALYELGKMAEAYQSVGNKTKRFEQLARHAIAKDRWEDVQSLLATHKSDHPNDAAVHYIEGELAAHADQWEEAIAHFQQGLNVDPEEYKWYWETRFRQVCIESGQWKRYYESHEDPEEAFDILARNLVADENWKALEALSEEHRKRHHEDVGPLKYAAQAAWEREEYKLYASLAKKVLELDDEEELPSYERDGIEKRLVSAWLRDDRPLRAEQFARKKAREDGDVQLQAIVSAVAGRLNEARRLALQAAAKVDRASAFYRHQDVGEIFLDPGFRKLHEKYPVELPYYGTAETLAVLLFGEPQEIASTDIGAVLQQLEKDAAVQPLKATDARITHAFLVHLDNTCIWLAAGSGKYDNSWTVNNEESPLVEVVNDNQSWIAIGTASWLQSNSEPAAALARSIAAQFAEQAEALCVLNPDLWQTYAVFPAEKEQVAEWHLSGDLESLGDVVVNFEWSGEANDVVANRKFRQSLRKAARESERRADARLTVWAHLSSNLILDPLELEITSIERLYGSLQFEGTLQKSSAVLPQLKKGLPMRLEEYELQAWQLNDDPVIHRQQP